VTEVGDRGAQAGALVAPHRCQRDRALVGDDPSVAAHSIADVGDDRQPCRRGAHHDSPDIQIRHPRGTECGDQLGIDWLSEQLHLSVGDIDQDATLFADGPLDELDDVGHYGAQLLPPSARDDDHRVTFGTGAA